MKGERKKSSSKELAEPEARSSTAPNNKKPKRRLPTSETGKKTKIAADGKANLISKINTKKLSNNRTAELDSKEFIKEATNSSGRKSKNPFNILKGCSEATEDTLKLYAGFGPAPYSSKPSVAYIQGVCFDISAKLCTDMLVCRMLEQFVSASAASSSFLFLGLKDSLDPFNLFDFTEESKCASILVVSHELEIVDTLTFEHGIVVQLHVDEEPAHCRCTVLFHNGFLCQFDYSAEGSSARPVQRNNPNVPVSDEHIFGANASNARITNFVPIETSLRVIRFQRSRSVLAYTDGFVVAVNKNGSKKTTPTFRALIVDLALFMKDNEEHIFLIDRNGGHFYFNANLTGFTSAGSFPGFYKLACVPNYNVLLSTDGMTYKNFSEIAVIPKILRKACRYYLPTCDGSVACYRAVNKDRRFQMLFKIVNQSDGLVFCTSKFEFEMFSDARMNVVNVFSFDSYLLVVTEHGYIVRLNIE